MLFRGCGQPLAQVPLEAEVARAGDAGLPVIAARPDSPAARALAMAAEAVAAHARRR